MIDISFFEDPTIFYEEARQCWEVEETRNSLILGLALSLKKNIYAYGKQQPMLALARDAGNEIVASAVMTPPFAVVVQSSPLCEPALMALAEALKAQGWDLPGVMGVAQVSDRFAAIWQHLTGQRSKLLVDLRAYELRQVRDVSYPPGRMVIAQESQAQLAADMLNAMADEVILGPKRHHSAQSQLESIRQRCTFLWVDAGEVVSITIATRPQISGICVAGVYTPPEHRRKGYARALVAEVSRELLSRGFTLTNLFTDLANPTSNKIYQEVGYQPVCDYHQYQFVNDVPEAVSG